MCTLVNDDLCPFSTCSPAPFARARLLANAAFLTTGRRTVSNLLRAPGHLALGTPSSYHRVLSEAASPACGWPFCGPASRPAVAGDGGRAARPA